MERRLSELGAGESGIVSRVTADAKGMRMMELGFTRGTRLTVHRFAPLGDPMEVELRGYSLVIRKADAERVIVDNMWKTCG